MAGGANLPLISTYNRNVVLDAIRSVNEKLGVTALIVTHDPTVSDHVNRTVQIRDGRTSTEVHRDADRTDAQTFTVIDSVGRLQLPREYVQRLGMRDLVRLNLEEDHVQVHPDDRATEAKEKS